MSLKIYNPYCNGIKLISFYCLLAVSFRYLQLNLSRRIAILSVMPVNVGTPTWKFQRSGNTHLFHFTPGHQEYKSQVKHFLPVVLTLP